MHAAVDALSTLSIAFPDMTNIPELTTPDEKWAISCCFFHPYEQNLYF